MLRAKTPKEHKSLGRKVRNFDHKLWDESKHFAANLHASLILKLSRY